MFDPKSTTSSWPDFILTETPDHQNVLSPLVSAYHECGYEAGFDLARASTIHWSRFWKRPKSLAPSAGLRCGNTPIALRIFKIPRRSDRPNPSPF